MFTFNTNPEPLAPVLTSPIYSHGYTDDEVREYVGKFKELEGRDKGKYPLSLEEQLLVFKVLRIKRTEAFILQPVKVAKAPKVPKVKVEKVKVPKEKKKTKAQLKAEDNKMMALLLSRNMGGVLSEEDNEWLNNKLKEMD